MIDVRWRERERDRREDSRLATQEFSRGWRIRFSPVRVISMTRKVRALMIRRVGEEESSYSGMAKSYAQARAGIPSTRTIPVPQSRPTRRHRHRVLLCAEYGTESSRPVTRVDTASRWQRRHYCKCNEDHPVVNSHQRSTFYLTVMWCGEML
ncbi:hypothetical protein EXIGLDRAFT_406961 [Exidia glandulosa HHB12029]|uniref:Uncharacterized protein n=1 Tax=Exidia glandulosa HHB12029 TaxID=1314781 RepID=A0A165BII5_EXIGL|nr:hypothetical protein EXIGLDRAFT_406961 [Exidia glandulosa HHB12029]